MSSMAGVHSKPPRRQLHATILHFDYDCFYAAVFEHDSPNLKTVPLAVQQKQIVVTCNYEARRRGLSKLQLVTDAKKLCPDLVIVLGEDLTPFRNASKDLYSFLCSFSWNARCERLGFDEVFMDVSDIIAYNAAILNANNLSTSFFCLSKSDPTIGFSLDATALAGHAYPEAHSNILEISTLDPLQLHLFLGSHLAQYIRHKLELEKGYTATVGVATNKLLAKLVGNVHKPNGQTTLLPPYTSLDESSTDNVTTFVDAYEIGKIPGIGFKFAQKLRAHVLQRPADIDTGLVYGGTKEMVTVGDVRRYPHMGPETIQDILGGPGVPQNIGTRIWDLLNGCDNTEVGQARAVPTQISIEDSYMRLDTIDDILKELCILATSLVKRMHIDLLEDDQDDDEQPKAGPAHDYIVSKRWLAHPRTIRLSTRPRPPQNPDGRRHRSFARISKSAPMPGFAYSLKDDRDVIVSRLVHETLLPLFRKLHPEKSGWNLSLVNVAVTNMADAASDKGGVGRDIAKMFQRQDDVLKQWRVVEETQVAVDHHSFQVAAEPKAELVATADPMLPTGRLGSEDIPSASQAESITTIDHWESEDEEMVDLDSYQCEKCGAVMPLFAMGAHERWHTQR